MPESISREAASAVWPPAPKPDTRLAHYRRLAPSAGVFVSPIQFGAMSIGNAWPGIGAGDKEYSFKLLDAYYGAGGNFIDTASLYQFGQSEEIIGDWMEARNNRDEIVLATKYSGNWQAHVPNKLKATFVGDSYKSMYISLEASLKKLKTHYVDIFYVHAWDYTSSIEEVMNGLHTLVTQGKVLYLGASDTPAWVVAEANRYAKDHGKTPFVIYQGLWNVTARDFEREIIPMARAHGMALAPWNVLVQGKIRTDAEEEERRKTGQQGRPGFSTSWERSEDQKKMCKALEKVAAEVGAKSIRSVAIAYVMQKTTHVFPILGVKSVEQIQSNMEALEVALTPEHIKFIEDVLPFDPGFPHNMLGDGTVPQPAIRSSIYFEQDPVPPALRPSKD
ncbi:Aldo/keto reductase [Panus rudis PR-1116 ss-1]|nr:Aldo/keto reductase [Panus rudis PR-1116 ss-1]